MEPRLTDAAYAGDVAMLRELLQEDRLLLRRQAGTGAIVANVDGLLHIAAALGHSDFVKEILVLRHEVAPDLNGEGLTALHLASSRGHLSVVKELLQCTSGSQLCLRRDKDGLTPVHAAVIKGRVDVLRELVDASAESLRAQTKKHGYSVLHLAVISNYFDSVEFLVEKIGEDDELLNLKDDEGNTALHLAVARKQLQTVKLLLSRSGIKVNDVNSRGATALDVLLESPMALHGDLILGETIRAAGGRTALEQQTHQQPQQHTAPVRINAAGTANFSNSTTSKRFNLSPRVRRKLLGNSTKGDHLGQKYKNMPGTIMVVATLIATITFQAGLNPPGGFIQEDGAAGVDSAYSSGRCKYPVVFNRPKNYQSRSGEATLNGCLGAFLVFDTVGLIASLSIILLLLCCVPRRNKKAMRVLVWIMWLAVFSTATAFLTAIAQIFTYGAVMLVLSICWSIILLLFMCNRLILFLGRKVGCCKKKRKDGGTTQVRFCTMLPEFST